MHKIDSKNPVIPISEVNMFNYKGLSIRQMFIQSKLDYEKALNNPINQIQDISIYLTALENLKKESRDRYRNFCIANNTLTFKISQKFFNSLSERIVNFISYIFPFNLLFNYVKNIKSTKIEYYSYQSFIENKVACLQRIQEVITEIRNCKGEVNRLLSESKDNGPAKLQSFKEAVRNLIYSINQLDSQVDKKDLLLDLGLEEYLTETLLNGPKELENKVACLQRIQEVITEIRNCKGEVNRLLRESKDNGPAKLQSFKEAVRNLIYSINQLDSQVGKKDLLLDLGLEEYLTETLLNGPKELLAQGKEETFRFFIEQLAGVEYAQSLFKPYQEVLQFDVDQRGNLQLFKHTEGQRPVRQRPNCLDTYQGLIRINIRDITNLKSLTELREILATHPNCQPGLTINWGTDQNLTEEVLQLLSEIKSYIPYIQVEGLQELDLTSLQEEQFFSLLPFLDFSQTNLKLCLSSHMENWSEKQLYALKKLPVNSLDLSQMSSENLTWILSNFPSVPHLTLNQPALTNKDFKELITRCDLQHLVSLNLTGCNQLTTDSLGGLTTLNSLQELIYSPDMQLGNPLLLPPLSNPFDIKRFYISAFAIHPLINQLYEGPLLFAPIFQIPLVRQGGKYVFSEKQTYLASSSVTYWLYKNDYENLTPQLAIQSLFADNCPYLNDQNLSDFLQKFPATNEVSLCNCPGITDTGVLHMLQESPQIVKLDLTSCPGITERLFAEENHEILSNLESITVSDTQLTVQQNESLPATLRRKIIFENKTLKITEEELKAVGSLEAALNNHLPLNKLIYLDLSDCKSLKDSDFEHLISRFNLELEIEQEEAKVPNPYRLNISRLNLKGTMCLPQWFANVNLGNLQQVLVDEIKATVLQEQHPDIHFQHTYTPIVQTINMDKHLNECSNFLQNSESSLEKQLRAKKYLHHRTLVELFGEDCIDKNLLKNVLSHQAHAINQEEFHDLELAFIDNFGNLSTSYLFKEDAYCQSISLRTELRPGGLFFKSTFPIYNANATPPANRLIAQLIQGQPLLLAETDWKAIAEAAELANPHNLNMPAFYRQLMNALYQKIQNMPVSYLTNGEANNMLNKVIALEDEKAQILLEQRLLNLSVTNPASYEEVQTISSNLPNLDLGMSLVNALLTLYNDTSDPEIIDDATLFEDLLAQRNKEAIFDLLDILTLTQRKYVVGHLIGCLIQQMQAQVELL